MLIYKFISTLILYIKYSRILSRVYKEENILQKLSMLFGVTFRQDWIGRIYAVVNPNITNGQFDTSSQIFEYDENGPTNRPYVEKWIMQRMLLMTDFIKVNNLFDILTYKIKKLDDYDNYLFIIQPINLDDMANYSEKFAILLSILGIITVITYFLIKLNIV